MRSSTASPALSQDEFEELLSELATRHRQIADQLDQEVQLCKRYRSQSDMPDEAWELHAHWLS